MIIIKYYKKILTILLLSSLCFAWLSNNLLVKAYDDNTVSDMFCIEMLANDINADSAFNILDLIRLKKYIAGMRVAVNLKMADADGSTQIDAMDLVLIKKELLNGED